MKRIVGLFILGSCFLLVPVGAAESETLSVRQALARSRELDGKFVFIQGYLVREFEHMAIYGSSEDCQDRNWKAAIWVNLNDVRVSNDKGTYEIAGVLRTGEHGHMGRFSCELNGVGYLKRRD